MMPVGPAREFSSFQPGVVVLTDAGISSRDGTFFRDSDGTLTDYTCRVLIANAAWTQRQDGAYCFF